jgi:hypothetical protein
VGVRDCRTRKDDWYGGLVDELDPDVIVVSNRPIDDPSNPTSIVTPVGSMSRDAAEFASEFRDLTEQSLTRLRHGGRRVVIIEPIPIAAIDSNPLNCLSSATEADQCIFQANAKRTTIEHIYEKSVSRGSVWTFDVDAIVCPRLPTCDPVVNNMIVKRDSDHLTGTFAAAIGDEVGAWLHENGVLP